MLRIEEPGAVNSIRRDICGRLTSDCINSVSFIGGASFATLENLRRATFAKQFKHTLSRRFPDVLLFSHPTGTHVSMSSMFVKLNPEPVSPTMFCHHCSFAILLGRCPHLTDSELAPVDRWSDDDQEEGKD